MEQQQGSMISPPLLTETTCINIVTSFPKCWEFSPHDVVQLYELKNRLKLVGNTALSV